MYQQLCRTLLNPATTCVTEKRKALAISSLSKNLITFPNYSSEGYNVSRNVLMPVPETDYQRPNKNIYISEI